MVNMVYCFEDLSILICQNPDFKSKHEKWPAPTKLSRTSWILGSGYESFILWALRCQKSIQNCWLPSFFLTNTTALHHVFWLGQIAPESNISCKCLWTSSMRGRGIHLNHSLNGVSSVTLTTCYIEWVQLSLLGSNEKTSWYLAKRDWAEAISSGGHDSNLLRSNSQNNFSCLCFLPNLGIEGCHPLPLPSPPFNLFVLGALVPK